MDWKSLPRHTSARYLDLIFSQASIHPSRALDNPVVQHCATALSSFEYSRPEVNSIAKCRSMNEQEVARRKSTQIYSSSTTKLPRLSQTAGQWPGFKSSAVSGSGSIHGEIRRPNRSNVTNNHRGLTNAFGVFQTYYQQRFRDEDADIIALIGCIQPFVSVFGSFLAGPLWDAGYCKALIAVGSLLTSFAYMMTSICSQFWQVMLAQGVLAGIGSCLCFTVAVAAIPQYFTTKKALANGVAAAGSGLGELAGNGISSLAVLTSIRWSDIPNRLPTAPAASIIWLVSPSTGVHDSRDIQHSSRHRPTPHAAGSKAEHHLLLQAVIPGARVRHVDYCSVV